MSINRRTVVIAVVGVLVVVVLAVAILALYRTLMSPRVQGCLIPGCFNRLDIEFDGFQPAQYTVEVTTSDGETLVFNCPTAEISDSDYDPSGCKPNGAHLNGPTPDEVTVTVTWEGGTKTETFPVTYVPHGNGPACPATCKRSTVTMQLP